MQNVLIILRCSMNSRCGETKYQVPFQWVPDHVSTKGVYIVVSKEDWRRCPTLSMLGSIIGGAGFRTQLKPSCCNHCSSFCPYAVRFHASGVGGIGLACRLSGASLSACADECGDGADQRPPDIVPGREVTLGAGARGPVARW